MLESQRTLKVLVPDFQDTPLSVGKPEPELTACSDESSRKTFEEAAFDVNHEDKEVEFVCFSSQLFVFLALLAITKF